MKLSRRFAAAAMAAATVTGITVSGLAPATAQTTVDPSAYSVSSGQVVQVGHATDTPAAPYIDKDGTFYFQQAAALYGADDHRKWDFYTGANMDSAKFSNEISNAANPNDPTDRNHDTTARCNNSPTGLGSTYAEGHGSYSQRNYCDLAGVWVDPDTGDWYGLVHNEFTPAPFGDGLHYDAIDYAVSKDQGKTWTIKDSVITSPYSTKHGDEQAFPNQTYYYGDGDQRLIADPKSGYFYVFYGSRVINKGGGWAAGGFAAHVARAPMSQKMAKGSWQKYYKGKWQTPGVGGAESTITSTSQSETGYLPDSLEYNPQNTGNIATQVENGQLPVNGSDLFVMNVSYNAYLGMYIGTPQTDIGDGVDRPLRFYGTKDLATQKWVDLGGTPNYTQQSWYRWMLDGANATSCTIVGKTFRSYCYFSCSKTSGKTSSSEYVDVTIGANTPDQPVVSGASYRIQADTSKVLGQDGQQVSAVANNGSANTSWKFVATGDGAYKITNAASGQALGVPATSPETRAWGTKLSLSTIAASGPTAGQQWFVVADVATPATQGAATNTGKFRLVNRYSGLVLSLADAASTTPQRNWANTGTAGDVTNPKAQVLSLEQVSGPDAAGIGQGSLVGASANRCLDVPNHAATNGTSVLMWDCNEGANQAWTLTQDGSVKVFGNMCLDVPDSRAVAGAKVGIWACNGGANQHWSLAADGTIRSALAANLCLDVKDGTVANGAAVQLWNCTGGTNQKWHLRT